MYHQGIWSILRLNFIYSIGSLALKMGSNDKMHQTAFPYYVEDEKIDIETFPVKIKIYELYLIVSRCNNINKTGCG